VSDRRRGRNRSRSTAVNDVRRALLCFAPTVLRFSAGRMAVLLALLDDDEPLTVSDYSA